MYLLLLFISPPQKTAYKYYDSFLPDLSWIQRDGEKETNRWFWQNARKGMAPHLLGVCDKGCNLLVCEINNK